MKDGKLIELNTRSRGRTGDASCNNATVLQGDARTILVEYETHVGVCVY